MGKGCTWFDIQRSCRIMARWKMPPTGAMPSAIATICFVSPKSATSSVEISTCENAGLTNESGSREQATCSAQECHDRRYKYKICRAAMWQCSDLSCLRSALLVLAYQACFTATARNQLEECSYAFNNGGVQKGVGEHLDAALLQHLHDLALAASAHATLGGQHQVACAAVAQPHR